MLTTACYFVVELGWV